MLKQRAMTWQAFNDQSDNTPHRGTRTTWQGSRSNQATGGSWLVEEPTHTQLSLNHFLGNACVRPVGWEGHWSRDAPHDVCTVEASHAWECSSYVITVLHGCKGQAFQCPRWLIIKQYMPLFVDSECIPLGHLCLHLFCTARHKRRRDSLKHERMLSIKTLIWDAWLRTADDGLWAWNTPEVKCVHVEVVLIWTHRDCCC